MVTNRFPCRALSFVRYMAYSTSYTIVFKNIHDVMETTLLSITSHVSIK